MNIYKDLTSLTEVDWSKVRDMSFNEDRTAKLSAIDTIAGSPCFECHDFLEHVEPDTQCVAN